MFIEPSLISSNETKIRPSEAIMPNKFVINYEAIFNLLQQMRYYIQNYSELMELSKPFRNEHFFFHRNGYFYRIQRFLYHSRSGIFACI